MTGRGWRSLFFVVAGLAAGVQPRAWAAAGGPAPEDPTGEFIRSSAPLSPEEERQAFTVPPGFAVQLFAAEPAIKKPMNLAFDARGRLWVTETVEYPVPAPVGPGARPGRDSLKILEDRDGDGRAETITTFADDLNIPIGVLPYGDGAIVWSIPNIWFLHDTDGDGKADRREVLYGPLGWEDDAHGMSNSFTRGYDGWMYLAHGYRNTSVVRGRDGSVLKLNSGNIFRVRADGGRVEPFTFGQVNPFGLAFDARGNLYSADCHSQPITQLLRGAYYQSFGKPHDGLGFGPDLMSHSHGSTGIAGIALYDDDNWPEEFRDNVLLGNVITSRINRDRLRFSGSSPRASEQPDFLTSRDGWFRPVDLKFGPDGALYVADFYNRIIGHYEVPINHPGRDRERGRIWRVVYRGSAEKPAVAFDVAGQPVPALIEALGDARLVRRMTAMQVLADRGGVEVTTAVRALFAPGGAAGADVTTDRRRAHALWVLLRAEGGARGGVDADIIARALRGGPLLRIHAMEVLGASAAWTEVHRRLARAGLADPDAQVARAAAAALGRQGGAVVGAHDPVEILAGEWDATPEFDSHRRHVVAMSLRDQLRGKGVFDRWSARLGLGPADPERPLPARAALLAALAFSIRSASASSFLLTHLKANDEPQERLLPYLRHIARHADTRVIGGLAAFAQGRFGDDLDFQIALLQSVEQGLARGEQAPPPSLGEWARALVKRTLAAVQAEPDAKDPQRTGKRIAAAAGFVGTLALADLVPDLKKLARDNRFDLSSRTAAWDAVIGMSGDRAQVQLVRLVADGTLSEEMRETFAAALAAVDPDKPPPPGAPADPSAPAIAAAMTAADSPARARLAESLSASTDGAATLLALLESGTAPITLLRDPGLLEKLRAALPTLITSPAPRERSPAAGRRVREASNASRLDALITQLPPENSELAATIAARRAAFTTATPSAKKGRELFVRICAACHRINLSGGLIGPQLDGIGGRGVDRLLEDILDPNRNVDAAFRMTYVATKDGEIRSGMVRREEGALLILADLTGQEIAIAKRDITSREPSQSSIMPDNVAELLSPSELADLLAYLLAQR